MEVTLKKSKIGGKSPSYESFVIIKKWQEQF